MMEYKDRLSTKFLFLLPCWWSLYRFNCTLFFISDFSGMKFFGWLLRNCGAFYIRRSFGDDQLYWAVFTEYVQTQICNADNPIEFYVEGTRSRTQKSYCPKFGKYTVLVILLLN